MKRIVVGDWDEAKTFTSEKPYAMISFVGSHHHRTPPQIKRPAALVARITIKADDALPNDVDMTGKPLPLHLIDPRHVERNVLFTERDAQRIARFVARVGPRIDTLFIHCVQGLGRSPAAAIAIAKKYGVPTRRWERDPFAPNPHVLRFLSEALKLKS